MLFLMLKTMLYNMNHFLHAVEISTLKVRQRFSFKGSDVIYVLLDISTHRPVHRSSFERFTFYQDGCVQPLLFTDVPLENLYFVIPR